MSSQESRRTVRNTRQRKIVLDLNVPPPNENREQEGTSAHTGSQGGPSAQQRGSMPPPIDLEAIDDDVTISSPRAFEQVWFPSFVKLHSKCIFFLSVGCVHITTDYILNISC